MRILMINVVCGIRSTGRICTDLAAALENQGHEVKIAYGRETVPSQFEKYAIRIGNNLDIKLHGIKSRFFDGAGFGSKKATEKFIEWVKKYNPDIIHLHNLHGYYINIEVLFDYLKDCGKKIIWTLHDCWAFTGHSAYCDAVKCTRWENGCYKCPQKKEYPSSFIDLSARNWKRKKELITAIQNMTIVTPSNWLAGLVNRSFMKKYEVRVIHNGIDTSQFYPVENDFRKIYGLENKFVVIGVSSSWDDMKGYSDFLKLSKLVNSDTRIVLVGVSARQKRELPPNIIGIEKTNSIKELVQIYSASDVFVNLTYCDNYPTVNIEALSCGTPVVTYDTGGSTESVDKEWGYVIEQGNIEKVNELLRKMQCNSIRLDTINFDSTSVDKSKMLKGYLEIFCIKNRLERIIRGQRDV